MFRRTNGRPPLYLIGGLTIVIVFLSVSYWNLNTQNNDVLQSLEKMQASLKIEEVKIAQSERKTSTLQDILHSNEEVIKKLEEKLSSLEQVIQNCNNNLNKRENEITLLKDQADDLQGKLREADIKVGDLESDNERLAKENEIIISQREDAISALDKRDEQIIELARKVQQERARNKQLDANLSALSKQLAASSAQLAELQDKAAQRQDQGGEGKDLGPIKLLGQHADSAPRGDEGDRDAGNEVGVAAKPEAAAEGVHSDAAAEDKDGAAVNVLPAPVAGGGAPGGMDGPPHQPPNDVIPPPPDFNDNLDAAIDEGEHPGDDPLMPDQDPDGGDEAPNEDLLQDHRVHEDRVHDEALDRPVRAAGGGNKVPILNRVGDNADIGGNGVAVEDIDREHLLDTFEKDNLGNNQVFDEIGNRGDEDVDKDIVADEFQKGPHLDKLGDTGIGDEDQKVDEPFANKFLKRRIERKSELKTKNGKEIPDAEMREDGGEEGNDVGGERVDGFGNKLSKEGFVDGDGNVIEGAGKDGDPVISNGQGQMDYRLQENIGENSLAGEEEEEEDLAQKADDLRPMGSEGNEGDALVEQSPIRIGV